MDTRKLGVAGEHMEVDAFFSRSRLDAVGRHSDYQKEPRQFVSKGHSLKLEHI